MLWRAFWKRTRVEDPQLKDKQELLKEIHNAQSAWQHALQRLDYAVSHDEIDYAIFALEAAEKRYEMLLKTAKRLSVHVLQDGMGRAAGG